MLLDTDDLIETLERFAERQGKDVRFDRSVVVAALEEAGRLASGQSNDEPAALFVALARRSRAFHPVAETFISSAARAQAIALGHDLRAESIELTVLRAGIVRGELAFVELRAWFAERLRPIGS